MVKITHTIRITNGAEKENSYELRLVRDVSRLDEIMYNLSKPDLLEIQVGIIKILSK